ncbi:MAG: hypothetical protein JWQ74_1211 [Marmoricola sp.]|nr:hypothetical protein [Marmoricola sp.]
MLRRFRAVLPLAVAAALLGGCASTPPAGPGQAPSTGGGKVGAAVALATGTCWSGAVLGADPQVVLRLAKKYGVTYFDAAHALAEQPAFSRTRGCNAAHAVEIYKTVATTAVKPVVKSYATLLRPGRKAYRTLDADLQRACMNQTLFDAAAASGLSGAVMEPAFPEGVKLGWAPPSPDQWGRGQRVFACTVTQTSPGTLTYAKVFSKAFPTQSRTCIDTRSLVYVDCARKHQRERISVLDLTATVAAGKLPGSSGIETGSDGRFLDLSPSQFAALDRSCTAYLRKVSTTSRLSGVAEADVDQWPTAEGRYLVACEADRPTTKDPITTQGSVFDRR